MSPTRLIGYTNNRCETANFLLAKEKPSHRFHPVGEIFLLRVVAVFSFFWGACLLLMLGTSGWQLAYGRYTRVFV